MLHAAVYALHGLLLILYDLYDCHLDHDQILGVYSSSPYPHPCLSLFIGSMGHGSSHKNLPLP